MTECRTWISAGNAENVKVICVIFKSVDFCLVGIRVNRFQKKLFDVGKELVTWFLEAVFNSHDSAVDCIKEYNSILVADD